MTNSERAFTRRQVLAGGCVLGGIAATGLPGMEFDGIAAAATAADKTQFDDLQAMLRGDFLLPDDAGYDTARSLWNGMIDKRPSAVVRCSGVADVIDVVGYARKHKLPVSVRGGGHNVAGKALRDGAIDIDLSRMRGIRVDPERQTARVAGGALWADVDHETLVFDLVTTGGTVSSTGVGGLTLGGGLGWLMRKYGLACDNLVSADIVTADGKLLTASESENPDLFWAIRGGGGNFGVVTSFEFGLHPLEPITGGIVLYPQSMLHDMLQFFREYTATLPDSVTAMSGVSVGAPGTPLAGQNPGWIAACHIGPAAEGERLLKPVKALGPPAVDLIGPTSYAAMQTMFDAGSAPGRRNYWRSNFMTAFPDGAIDAIVAGAETIPSPGTMVLIEHMQGAVGRVGEHATAFSNRSAAYNTSVLAGWADAADDARNIGWTRQFGDRLKAFATGGGYVNYMSADESAERVHATYKANFDRLTEVKRKYDPTNFFSGNQNIAP